MDRRDRRLVVLMSPAELPAATANRPGAKAEARDLKPRGAELHRCELCLVWHDVSLHSYVDFETRRCCSRRDATTVTASAPTTAANTSPAVRRPATSPSSPTPTTGSEIPR